MKDLRFLVLVCFGITCLFISNPVSAKSVTLAQVQQSKRIKTGVQSGALTKAEAKNLTLQQKKIQQMIKRSIVDGKTTQTERRRVRKAQAKAKVNIFKKKHNKRTREKR